MCNCSNQSLCASIPLGSKERLGPSCVRIYRRVHVECSLLVFWEVCKVDGEVGCVHLIRLVFMDCVFSFAWIRRDQDDVVSLCSVWCHADRLVLERLLVLEAVNDAIGCNSHDDLIDVLLLFCAFELVQKLVAERLAAVLVSELVLMANQTSLVILFQGFVVVCETLNKLSAIVLFLFFNTPASAPVYHPVDHDRNEKPHGARVVRHEGRVHVCHRSADVMAAQSHV